MKMKTETKTQTETEREQQRGRKKQGEEQDGVSETETDFTPGEYQFQICQAAAGQSAASGSTFRCQQAAGRASSLSQTWRYTSAHSLSWSRPWSRRRVRLGFCNLLRIAASWLPCSAALPAHPPAPYCLSELGTRLMKCRLCCSAANAPPAGQALSRQQQQQWQLKTNPAAAVATFDLSPRFK